ncbi:hypothetical protein C3942_09285 [Solimonas fluminis]|uniref:Uncharacterized protein n=1 Tax=Solimonas fluminis TaxID=2086571 RepID=A0A2S5TGV5_9GAMM|nr:hypothetical protein [Solimonas fluminis]PPE74213.1 hypothetical protein C3942_09285 [Solimonas fluminis]
MQLETVISDAALCAAALAAMALARSRPLAVAGFAVIALAAAAGSLRYGPVPALQPWHQGLSFLAGTLGLPLVLLAYAGLGARRAAPAVGALLLFSAAAWIQPQARLLVGLATLLGWALLLWRERRLPPLVVPIGLGIVATLAAGAFAPRGRWPQVDSMHYALALAQLGFGAALRRREMMDNTTALPRQVASTGESCANRPSAAPPAP